MRVKQRSERRACGRGARRSYWSRCRPRRAPVRLRAARRLRVKNAARAGGAASTAPRARGGGPPQRCLSCRVTPTPRRRGEIALSRRAIEETANRVSRRRASGRGDALQLAIAVHAASRATRARRVTRAKRRRSLCALYRRVAPPAARRVATRRAWPGDAS